ncbi:MAG: TonB-dependent receptor [Micropepsaceae bacterium]
MDYRFKSSIVLTTATLLFAETFTQTALAEAVEKIVVTGTRIGAVPEDKLGTAVTVLDGKQIEHRQTRYVADILRDVPSIAVSRSGGAGGTTQVRMRGSEGNHTLILFGGADIGDPFQGEFDFSGLQASDVARIEVLRGSQSALYGSDAIGGVIYILPRQGNGELSFEAQAEAGSFSSLTAGANAGFGNDVFDIYASTNFHETSGTNNSHFGHEADGASEQSYLVNVGLRPLQNIEFRAFIRQVDTRAEGDPQDFNFFSATQGLVIDGNDVTHTKSTFGNISVETSAWNGILEAKLNYSFIDASRFNFSDGFASFFSEGHRDKVSAVSAVNLTTGNMTHKLTGAIDWKAESYQNLPISISTPVNDKRFLQNLGFVGEYTISSGDFDAGAAVRTDDNDRFRNATTYRLQTSYKLGDTRLRATAGTGIKNPTNFELFGFDPTTFIGNPGLKAEKSTGWDVGVDQYVLHRAVKLTATYFHADLDDEIFTDFLPGFISTPRNRSTRSTRQGIELTADVRLERWSIAAAYTYLDAKEDGIEEVRRAPHIASLNLSYDISPEAQLGMGLRYNGEQKDNEFIFATPADFVTLKSYTLVNVYASWNVTDRIEAFGRVENLLDQNYEEVFSFASPGISAYAGLKAKF